MSITTPLRPETPEELAELIRGTMIPLANALRDRAGIHGALVGSDLHDWLNYLAMRIETGPSRPAFRGTSRQPDPEHPA